jgi:hypothetical protein
MTSTTELHRLPEEVCKQALGDWRDRSTAEYVVQAELFDKKQFITDEEI